MTTGKCFTARALRNSLCCLILYFSGKPKEKLDYVPPIFFSLSEAKTLDQLKTSCGFRAKGGETFKTRRGGGHSTNLFTHVK